MDKFKILVAESLCADDFYERDWEGNVVEEIVRLLRGRTFYRIVITPKYLAKAVTLAAKHKCDVFHLSCHGNETGIFLTDETHLSWKELAKVFQKADPMPKVLVLSSCLGGDKGLAQAFKKSDRRPDVIFGAEADEPDNISFAGACISWPILYTELVDRGLSQSVFMDAVNKMNTITPHQFVYRRWKTDRYVRHPAR
jgi:hypothetical protein